VWLNRRNKRLLKDALNLVDKGIYIYSGDTEFNQDLDTFCNWVYDHIRKANIQKNVDSLLKEGEK